LHPSTPLFSEQALSTRNLWSTIVAPIPHALKGLRLVAAGMVLAAGLSLAQTPSQTPVLTPYQRTMLVDQISPQPLRTLLQFDQEREAAMRETALGYVAKGDPRVIPLLLDILVYLPRYGNPISDMKSWQEEQTQIAEMLQGVGFDRERAIPELLAALRLPDANLRARALLYLGNLRDVRAVDAVAGFLESSDAVERSLAIRALGLMNARAWIPRIEQDLRHPDPKVRRAAVQSLRLMEHTVKDPELIPYWLLERGDWDELKSLGEQARPALILAVQSHGPLELNSLRFLTTMGGDDVVHLAGVRLREFAHELSTYPASELGIQMVEERWTFQEVIVFLLRHTSPAEFNEAMEPFRRVALNSFGTPNGSVHFIARRIMEHASDVLSGPECKILWGPTRQERTASWFQEHWRTLANSLAAASALLWGLFGAAYLLARGKVLPKEPLPVLESISTLVMSGEKETMSDNRAMFTALALYGMENALLYLAVQAGWVWTGSMGFYLAVLVALWPVAARLPAYGFKWRVYPGIRYKVDRRLMRFTLYPLLYIKALWTYYVRSPAVNPDHFLIVERHRSALPRLQTVLEQWQAAHGVLTVSSEPSRRRLLRGLTANNSVANKIYSAWVVSQIPMAETAEPLMTLVLDQEASVRQVVRLALSKLSLSDEQQARLTLLRLRSPDVEDQKNALAWVISHPELDKEEGRHVIRRSSLLRWHSLFTEDVRNKPPEDQGPYEKQVVEAVGRYMAMRSVSDDYQLMEEYEAIADLASVVHDNLPLCLNSLANLKLGINDMEPLRKALPLNNPLTRIIRMLGEPPDLADGFSDVVLHIRKSGQWDHFFQLILDVARSKQRSAPVEVNGILDVLRAIDQRENTGFAWILSKARAHEESPIFGLPADLIDVLINVYRELRPVQRLARWNADRWAVFSRDIQDYYNTGLKVITLDLFRYFQGHRHDAAVIGQFRLDVENATQDIAWGSFFGFPKKFAGEYGIGDAESLALLARYGDIANYGLQDYTRIYRDVANALALRTRETWTSEVPPVLRTLYRLPATRSQIVFAPTESISEQNLTDLTQRLTGWMQDPKIKTLDDVLASLEGPLDGVCAWGLQNAPILKSAPGRESFSRFPMTAPEQVTWLLQWSTLLGDTMKNELKPELQKRLEKMVERADPTVRQIESRMSAWGFRWVRLSDLNRLLGPSESDLGKLLRAGDIQALVQAYQDKWILNIPLSELSNTASFNAWIDRNLLSVQRHLGLSEREVHNLRDVLDEARENLLHNEKPMAEFRRRQFITEILRRMLQEYGGRVDEIRQIGSRYKETTSETDQSIFVGWYDDLLHLILELTGSNVCTLWDRARQVREGVQEGYHFAVLALKDSTGRAFGWSQVQLLKTPLQNTPNRENRGYRVLAMTGINLSQKEIPLERERAVLALLKTAYELKESAGLQGVVIPLNTAREGTLYSIYTNQPAIHGFMEKLVAAGILVEGELAAPVTLSKEPHYTYQKVWILTRAPDIPLEVVASGQAAAEQDKQDSVLSKTHRSFGQRLGHVRHNGELPGDAAERLVEQLDEALSDMPQEVISGFRDQLRDSGLALEVIYEPTMPKSCVVPSREAITIFLGRDVIYGKGLIEPLGLREALAESIVTQIVPGYQALKRESVTNENAWLKIELIKGLLNFKQRIPLHHRLLNWYAWTPDHYWHDKAAAEQSRLRSVYAEQLAKATDGWTHLHQWNVFLNVMSGADPKLLVSNYLEILSRDPMLTDPLLGGAEVYRLIERIASADVETPVSFAHVRNVVKDVFMEGKVSVSAGSTVKTVQAFADFNDPAVSAWMDTLLRTKNAGEFYETLHHLVMYVLPLSPSAEDPRFREFLMHPEKDLMAAPDRGAAVRGYLEDLMKRRVGRTAWNVARDQLRASRGDAVIPSYELLHRRLIEGEDESGSPRDWTGDLFVIPARRGEDDQPPLSQTSFGAGLAFLIAKIVVPFMATVHKIQVPAGFELALALAGSASILYGIFLNRRRLMPATRPLPLIRRFA